MEKEIKQDKVMGLIVDFSGQTFSHPKDAYSWLDRNIRQLLKEEKEKDRQKFIEILEELNEFVETESGKSGRKEILQKIQEVIKQLKDEK